MQVVIFTEVCHGGFGRYAGTYRVATELREAGYTVQVVEFFTQWREDQIIKIIDKFVTKETKLIGFSCTFFLPQNLPWGGRTKIRNLLKGHDSNSEKQGDERNPMPGNPGVASVLFGRDDIFNIFDYIKQRSPASKIVVGGARSNLAED